jgi:hypothetical protein
MESEVAQAIRVNDRAVLRKYGRFLEPISEIVQGRLAARMDQRTVEAAMRNVSEQKGRPPVCAAAATGLPSNQ